MGGDLAKNWFKNAGLAISEAPTRIEARCSRRARATIVFNSSDPDSVARASNAALSQPCSRLCDSCDDPTCLHRRLEDTDIERLLRTFGK